MTKVVAYLYDRETGFGMAHSYEVDDEYADTQVFMWEDGNYACDCNRLIFMYSLDIDGDKVQCGTGRVRCMLLTVDGQERYRES